MNLIDLIKKECPNGVEYKKLGEICEIKRGERITKKDLVESGYPVISGGENIFGYFNKYNRAKNTITIAQYGQAGYIDFQKNVFWANDVCFSVYPNKEVLNKYLFYFLKSKQKYLYSIRSIDSIPYSISKEKILNIIAPIPPIHIQEKIIKVLDSFTKYEAELDKRDKQYNYYLNYLLDFDNPKVIDKLLNYSKIEYKSIGDVTEYIQPTKYIVNKTDYSDDCKTPVLTPGKTFILGYTNEETGIFPGKLNPVILFDDFTTDFKWVDFDFKVKSSASKIIHSADENKFLIKYIYFYMKTIESKNFQEVVGTIKRQWISEYSNKKIPIPSIDIQHKIVNLLDNFETMCKDLKIGLPAELSKRQEQYKFYRDYIFAVLTNNEELVDNLSHTHTHTF